MKCPIRLAYADLTGVASDSLRLVLIAENGEFSAAVYNLDDLVNPIAKTLGQRLRLHLAARRDLRVFRYR